MTLISDVFPEIPAPKKMIRLMSKKSCFRGLLETKRGKSVETLNGSTFTIFINQCERSCIGKNLF